MIRAFLAALAILSIILPPPADAAESLTLSVTPPLFQLSMGPGEFWASSIKIVNTNSFDVLYYTTPVTFEPTGERGTGSFTPVQDEFGSEPLSASFARWITITSEPTLVPAGQSRDVPFSISVPTDAPPGGHYAAVLVGTQPPNQSDDGSKIAVSSYVSTLFFLKLRGEVIESGRIREFTTARELLDRPDTTFTLRFENTGTVHVRPVGEIVIYNMWGKERGVIDVNHKSSFGNVLPKSVRRYEFAWNGEFSALDIGRYRAEVTLGFGDDAKRTVSATTYFWVVPVVPVLSTIGGFLAFVLLLIFFVRRYIRSVLRAEQERMGVAVPKPVSRQKSPSNHSFLGKHQVLFAFLIYIGISAAVFAWYFGEALVDSRTYTVEELEAGPESNPEIPEND